jgi:hypothetical protein
VGASLLAMQNQVLSPASWLLQVVLFHFSVACMTAIPSNPALAVG